MADFWAGYISGAASIIIGSPLDIIKVRLQSHSHAPRQTYYSFGSVGSLVKGAAAPILGYGALNALLFASYNRSLGLLGESPVYPQSLWRIWAAGAVGGLAVFVVSAPTEVCLPGYLPTTTSSPWGLQYGEKVVGEMPRPGPRGLYLGGVVTSLRDSIGYGFYFWSYEGTKQLLATTTDTRATSALKILLSGGVAGCATWLSIYPLDVIKTRVQTQIVVSEALLLPQQGDSAVRTELGTWECAKAAYREGGWRVFSNGLGVCMLRAFLVSAVGWVVYERVMDRLQPVNEPMENWTVS